MKLTTKQNSANQVSNVLNVMVAITVCTFDSSSSLSSNCNFSYPTKILLQFARATVTSVDENQSANLCLLFDSGSQ